jgi:F0F1-type ATP synthase membrane subunit b/b'
MTTSNDPDQIRAEIEQTRAALSDDVDALADTANPKNIAKRQVDTVRGSVKDAVVGAKERVMGTADDVKDKVTGGAQDLKGRVAGSAEGASGTARDTVSTVGNAVSDAPYAAKAKTQGNPLAAGLIAFGAGLLISSLIPSSQKEQDAVSTLQDNLEPLKEKATEAAKDVAAQLKEPAQQAAESVKATASEGAENVKAEGVAAKDEVQGQVADSKSTVQGQVADSKSTVQGQVADSKSTVQGQVQDSKSTVQDQAV